MSVMERGAVQDGRAARLESFEDFYRQSAGPCADMLRYVFAYVRESGQLSPSEFDDVVQTAVQDAFLLAARRWDDYDAERSSPMTWLMMMARGRFSRAAGAARRQTRLRADFVELDAPGAIARVADETGAVILEEALVQILAGMPAPQVRVLHLRRDDHSYEEIAEQLETTPFAVKALLQRARESVRRGLAAGPCGEGSKP